MATKQEKCKVKVGLWFDPNTVSMIESLREEIPAGRFSDMVRYLMLRGIEAIQADRTKRAVLSEPKQ